MYVLSHVLYMCVLHHSTVLMSTYNHVYQCLANLIRWSDMILLHGENSLNKQESMVLIQQVQDGVNVSIGDWKLYGLNLFLCNGLK